MNRIVLIDMVNGTKKTMYNFNYNVFNAPPYKTKDL